MVSRLLAQSGEGVGAPGSPDDGVGDMLYVRVRTLDLAYDQHHERGTAWVARPEGVGPAQALKAFGQPPQFLEHGAQRYQGVEVVRVPLAGFAQGLGRFLKIARRAVGAAKVVVGLGQIGLEFGGAAMMADGLVQVAQLNGDVAQVGVDFGIIGPQDDGLTI